MSGHNDSLAPEGSSDSFQDNTPYAESSDKHPELKQAEFNTTIYATLNGLYHSSALFSTILTLYEQLYYGAEQVKHARGDTDFSAKDKLDEIDELLKDALNGLSETELAAIISLITGAIFVWKVWLPGHLSFFRKKNKEIEIEQRVIDFLLNENTNRHKIIKYYSQNSEFKQCEYKPNKSIEYIKNLENLEEQLSKEIKSKREKLRQHLDSTGRLKYSYSKSSSKTILHKEESGTDDELEILYSKLDKNNKKKLKLYSQNIKLAENTKLFLSSGKDIRGVFDNFYRLLLMWGTFNTGEFYSSAAFLLVMTGAAGFYWYTSYKDYENQNKFQAKLEELRQQKIRAYAIKLLQEQVLEKIKTLESLKIDEDELSKKESSYINDAVNENFEKQRAQRRYQYYFDFETRELLKSCPQSIKDKVKTFETDKTYKTRDLIAYLYQSDDQNAKAVAYILKNKYISASPNDPAEITQKTKRFETIHLNQASKENHQLYLPNFKSKSWKTLQSIQYGLYLFISTTNMAHFIPTTLFGTSGLYSLTGLALGGTLLGLGIGCLAMTIAWAWHMNNVYNRLSSKIEDEITHLNQEVDAINTDFHVIAKQDEQLVAHKSGLEFTPYVKDGQSSKKRTRCIISTESNLKNRLMQLLAYERDLNQKLGEDYSSSTKNTDDLEIFKDHATPTEKELLEKYDKAIQNKKWWHEWSDINKNSRNIAFGIIVVLIAVGAISTGGFWAVGMGVACLATYLVVQHYEHKQRKQMDQAIKSLRKDKLRAFAIDLVQQRIVSKQQRLLEKQAVESEADEKQPKTVTYQYRKEPKKSFDADKNKDEYGAYKDVRRRMISGCA